MRTLSTIRSTPSRLVAAAGVFALSTLALAGCGGETKHPTVIPEPIPSDLPSGDPNNEPPVTPD